MSGPAPVKNQPELELAIRIRDKDSGIWTVSDDKVRRLFCFRKGRLIHAASNIIEEQFEEFLVRGDYMDSSVGARSKLDAAREGVPFLQLLQDREILSASEIEDCIAAHIAELLLTALSARSFDSNFETGTPNLEGKPIADLAAQGLLFEHLKTHPKSSSEVRVRLGRPRMHPTQIEAKAGIIEELTRTHPVVGEVWQLSDGELTVSQLTKQISAGKDAALRVVYGLVLIGALQEDVKHTPGSRPTKDVPVTRKELLARVDRALDADHYGVLELMPGAPEEQIRGSYYLLARRYHPDHFRSGKLNELLPRIESFFAQVTEAYNTLTDPTLRRAYDEELAESSAKRASGEPEHDTKYLARQNFLRAKVMAKRNQFQQAVTFLENALQLDENVPEYHVEMGRVLTRNPRRRDEAEEHLRRGIELNPTVVDGHAALADLLMKRDHTETAIRVLNEALKGHPDHPELKRRLEELGVGKAKGRGLFGR